MPLLEALAELVFPTRCAGCDLPGALLCERCAGALTRIDQAEACPRCGAPDGAVRCGECAGMTLRFSGSRVFGTLDHPLARAIVLFKDAGERRLANLLAVWLLEAAPAEWLSWPDAVVGIPASPQAVLRRGFDHGALLAEAVGRLGGWRDARLLGCGARADQRQLGREERAANMSAALHVRSGAEVPPRVLLVDDVLTTGATLDAAAGALLAAGAAEVRALAVARACGR